MKLADSADALGAATGETALAHSSTGEMGVFCAVKLGKR
jgi:hypothetical protein